MIETRWCTVGSNNIKEDLQTAVKKMEEVRKNTKLYTHIYMTQSAWEYIKPCLVKPEPIQLGMMLYGLPLKVFSSIVDLMAEPTVKDENILAVDFFDSKLVQLDLSAIRGLISSYSLPIR
jgi:hypothetical protein